MMNSSLHLPLANHISQREYLISRMHEVTGRLNNVTMHPDLNIAHHLTFNDSKIENEASWAEYSSSKFYLLGRLVEVASTYDIHLILEVRGEMKQRILERYLLGKGFSYTKPREEMGGNVEVSLAKDSLSFGIHSHEGVRDLIKSPSAILALDTAFDPKSPTVQHIRTTYTRNNDLLPVIWLLVSNTCEHIELCLPDLPEADRLRLLLQYTAHLHDDVGDLQDNALGVFEDVDELLIYLRDSLTSWPLPIIEPLPIISPEDLESSTPSSEDQVPITQKRSLVGLYFCSLVLRPVLLDTDCRYRTKTPRIILQNAPDSMMPVNSLNPPNPQVKLWDVTFSR